MFPLPSKYYYQQETLVLEWLIVHPLTNKQQSEMLLKSQVVFGSGRNTWLFHHLLLQLCLFLSQTRMNHHHDLELVNIHFFSPFLGRNRALYPGKGPLRKIKLRALSMRNTSQNSRRNFITARVGKPIEISTGCAGFW